MGSIKIVSWNPQGIQKSGARTKQECDFLMKEYNHKKIDILTLMETHHQSETSLPQYIHDPHNLYHTPANLSDTYAGIVALVHKEWKVIPIKEIVEGRLLKLVIQMAKGKIFNVMCICPPPRKAVPGNYNK